MYGERNKLRLNQKKTMGARDLIAHSCVLGFLLVVLSPSVWADGFGGTTIAQPQDEKILDEKFTDPCQTHDGPGDPISPYNGRQFLQRRDMVVNGLFPIVVERRYNSQSTYDSPLGYGWALNHDRRLYEYADGSVALRYRCGRRDRFVFSGGAYVRPNGGQYGELIQNGDGTFTFTHHNLVRDTYDTEGRLIARQEPRGNSLEYIYDARGKLPLTGTSPYAVDPDQPMTVAYVHRLIRIEERTADGNLTGNAVDLSYDETTGRLMTIMSNDGRQITYLHDQTAGLTQGNLIQVNGLENIVSTYEYQDPDDAHNLTSIQEGAGTTPHTNVYDEQDRVIAQDYGNRSIQFDYAVDFTKTTVTKTITDDGGNILHTPVTVYHYDSQGYPEKIVDALGNEIQFNYNNQGFLIRREIWEKQGLSLNLLQAVDYTNDTAGNRLSETAVLDSGEIVTKSWGYDHNRVASEQVVSSLDPGKIFRTEYTFHTDADGIPTNIETIRRRKDDGTFQVVSMNYDTLGRLITVTLPDGHQLVGEYAGLYLTRVYHQIGASESPFLLTRFGYDTEGNRNLIIDARSNSTQVDYDDLGRVIKITNPLGEELLLTYIDNNLAQSEMGRTASDGEGQVVRLNHDSENRPASIERKEDSGNFILFENYAYDSDSNLLRVTDAENRTSVMEYDVLGRLVRRTDPLNNSTQFEYDAAGNRTIITDALNRKILYRYDDLNRLTQIEEQGVTLNQITNLAYDAPGNVTSVTDPENHPTLYKFDSLSRLKQIIQPLGQTVQYGYDARDRLSTVINARGQKIVNTYEPWGPVKTREHYPSVTATTPGRTISYAYDFTGNIETVSDDSIQTAPLYTFIYDALNRPDLTTLGYLPGGSRTLDYAYDRFGNRRQLVLNDGAALTHDYVYNKLNRLDTATLPNSQGFGFNYFDTDQLKKITHPSGIDTDYLYRPNIPVESITVAGETGQIEQFAYTYDKVLNVDTLTDNDGLHDYDYDEVNRLTQALHPTASGLPRTEGFAYDKVGNREDPSDSSVYDYDNNNRITQSPGLTYIFDDDGNMVTRSDGATLNYNAINRLTQYTKGTTTANYAYDPFGRRIKKTVNGVTTWFLWDQGRVLAKYDGTGARTKRYAYLPDGFVPVQTEDTTGLFDVHADYLGTPRFLTDNAQQVVWRNRQEVFGRGVVDEDVDGDGTLVTFGLRFPGQYFDQETGLHYNWHRYYDPRTGRYITSDPIGLAAGLNTYVYVRGNPIRFSDVTGLVNFLFGVGGSAAAPTGIEGSAGIVINPGFGGSQADLGVFGSAGTGGGVNISADIFVGAIKGGIENVSGLTGNVNIVAGPISFTFFFSEGGGLLGGTVGVGPGVPLPVQASGTVSATGTATIRDLLDLLFPDEGPQPDQEPCS